MSTGKITIISGKENESKGRKDRRKRLQPNLCHFLAFSFLTFTFTAGIALEPVGFIIISRIEATFKYGLEPIYS